MARLVPFGYGFRPFFLAAGWYALAAIGVWLWLYPSGLAPFGALPAYQWHAHEMLYGFVAAAVAGFMLTAVPSWTAERGFAGRPLVVLSGLWLLGRTAIAAAGVLPLPLVALAELVFLPAVAATIGLFLKAIWLFFGVTWAAQWPHARGAGAAATMILAVMTRASLGHTGRPLVVAKAIAWAYALLVAAAAVRVFGPSLLPLTYPHVIACAAFLWIAAFLLYVWVYTPILLRLRADGKPG
jgi:uncharacterized protein involved in response to NO